MPQLQNHKANYLCGMNYYELFNLPLSPVIDQAQLAKKYVALQRESHPDFFTKEMDDEREQALEKSADINKAYKIFKNPDASLAYYLQVKGVIVPGEKYELPPAFLMEMMELNESLTDNPAEGKAEAGRFEKELKTEQEKYIVQLNSGEADKHVMESVKSLYYRKKYLNRILERLAD